MDSRNKTIDFIQDMSYLKVGVIWREFQLKNQTIDFVDAYSDGEALLDCVSQKSFGVKHNTLCGVNEENDSIA